MVRKIFKIASIIILILIVLLGIGFAMGILGAPSGGIEDIGDWGEANQNRTEIITELWVENPNPIGLSLGKSQINGSYQLYLNEINLAEGGKKGINISSGRNLINISTYIKNQELQTWWVKFIDNNETIPVRAESNVDVDTQLISTSIDLPTQNKTILSNSTPIISSFSETASNFEGGHPQLAPQIVIRDGWATWGKVNKTKTSLLFHFRTHNPNPYPIPAPPEGIALDMDMNDIDIVEAQRGEFSLRNIDKDTVLMPNETREIILKVNMDNRKIDEWFRSHVEKNEKTNIDIQLQLIFNIQGQRIKIPQNGGLQYSCMMQTSILVDDQETSTNCGSGGSISIVEPSISNSNNNGLFNTSILNNSLNKVNESLLDNNLSKNNSNLENITDSSDNKNKSYSNKTNNSINNIKNTVNDTVNGL